jgi:hypothetical protein
MPKIPDEIQQPQAHGSTCFSQEKLALNVLDVDRIPLTNRQKLLGGKLDLTQAIWIDTRRVDKSAVVFTCALLEAACICDTIRNIDRRANDYPTRVYVLRESWTQLPGHVTLTRVIGHKVMLNRAVFLSQPALLVEPPKRAVKLFGR